MGMLVGTRRYEQELFADRLHRAFPDCNIFLVIREQISGVVSRYRKLIDTGGNVSLKRFVRTNRPSGGGWSVDMDYLYVDLLKYDRIINYYYELFGEDSVCVLPLEMMASEPDCFLKRLSSFSGHQVKLDTADLPQKNQFGNTDLLSIRRFFNMIFSPRSPSLLWFLNLIYSPEQMGTSRPYRYGREALYRAFSFVLGSELLINKEKQRQKKRVSQLLEGYFAESNAKTCELIGLDLEPFGYQLP